MEIKKWIKQIRPELNEDAIIIKKINENKIIKTQIIILNNSCCNNQLIISKEPNQINASDIFELKPFIHHNH